MHRTGAHQAPLEGTNRSEPGSAPTAQVPAPVDAVDPAIAWRDADGRQFAQVHHQYRARLESVAFRILRSQTDAEDVVQRIFLALRGIQFEGRASLWTYLYRAAVNGSVNVLRSKRRREEALGRMLEHERITSQATVSSNNPEAQVLEGEILASVAKAMLHVKPQHRRVLVLRLMHGLNNAEIAEREGLSPATVGTWLRRGREELRRGMRPLLREIGGTR